MTFLQALSKLFRQAFPISASRFGLSLFVPLGIASLASAGVQQQAAFGLAAIFNNWFLVVGPSILLSGFFKGAEAARRGQSIDRELLQSVLSLCAIVAALAVAATIVMTIALEKLYPNATGRLASQVLLVHSMSNIFYFYITGVMLYLEGMGRSHVIVAIIVLSLLLNTSINQVLMPHALKLAEPALLASWSLLIARVIGSIAVLRYLSHHVMPLRLRDLCFSGTPNTIKSLLRIGFANGAGKAAEASSFTCMGILAAALGKESMASYAVFYSFVSIVYMCMIGFTNATARSLVPAVAGAAPRFDLLRACVVVFAWVAVTVTALAVIDERLIWAWSASGQEVSPLLTHITLPSVAAALSFAAVFLASQICRSVGMHRSASACLLVTYPLLMLCMAWFFTQVHPLGLLGIVGSFIAANCFGLALLFILYWTHLRRSAHCSRGGLE